MNGRSIRGAAPALLLGLAALAAAENPRTGEVARFVDLYPKDGDAATFEAGYRRHLDLHRRNGDPWTWHGWTVVTGDRTGAFVNGTFGHSWAELDATPRLREDAVDNALNVLPFATIGLDTHLVRLPQHSRGEEEAALRSPFLTLLRVRLADEEGAFWAAVAESLGPRPRQSYRVAGGPTGSLLLALPHDSWTAFGSIEEGVNRLLVRAGPSVGEGHLETLRRRASLSYPPDR